MNQILISVASVAFTLVSTPVLAKPDAVSLSSDVKVDKTVLKDGKATHVLVAPQQVVPGDVLVFSTQFRNNGGIPVEGFVVTDPLPQGIADSTDGSDNAVVSVDDGKTWGTLNALTVPDGKGGARPAQASDVTHIRWSVAVIAPGGSGSVSYRGIVL